MAMLKAYCDWRKGCVVKLDLKQPCDAALDYFCTRLHISVSVFNYKFGCLRGCMYALLFVYDALMCVDNSVYYT